MLSTDYIICSKAALGMPTAVAVRWSSGPPTHGYLALLCPVLPSVTFGVGELERQRGGNVQGGLCLCLD